MAPSRRRSSFPMMKNRIACSPTVIEEHIASRTGTITELNARFRGRAGPSGSAPPGLKNAAGAGWPIQLRPNSRWLESCIGWASNSSGRRYS